ARRTLPAALLEAAPRPEGAGAGLLEGRAALARVTPVARQRARAPERDRARGRAARAGRGDPAERHPRRRGRRAADERDVHARGSQRREVPRGTRAHPRRLRAALPRLARRQGRGQHVHGGEAGGCRPHDALPPDGEARAPARHDHQGRLTRHMAWNRIDREAAEGGGAWPLATGGAAGEEVWLSVDPPALRAAAIAVANRFIENRASDLDDADLRVAVAGTALAVAAAYVDPAVPLPGSPDLHARIISALRSELLRTWSTASPQPDAREIIRLLQSFEPVEEACRRAAEERADSGAVPNGAEFVAGVAHDLRSPLT